MYVQVETMEVWKKKLGNIQGLIELVNTSQLPLHDITAIIEFIQVTSVQNFIGTWNAWNEKQYQIVQQTNDILMFRFVQVRNFSDCCQKKTRILHLYDYQHRLVGRIWCIAAFRKCTVLAAT